MRCLAAVLAFGLALVPAAAWREVCVIGAKNLRYTDQLPKDPAPDPWVKVEVDGEELCHSEYIPNKQNPLWKKVKQNGQYSEPACCQVSDSQADGYFWFSVFDAENVKWYGDYLGSAGFRLADVEGTFDLELEIDGKVPLDSTGKPSLLTVSVAANPPPPLPPLPPPPPPPPPARRFICVQSAIDLPDADFFPLSGNDLKPDAWAKVTLADEPSSGLEWKMLAENLQEELLQDLHKLADPLVKAAGGTASADGVCRTATRDNENAPRWQHCCEFTGASEGQIYVVSLFDEDALYGMSDYLGYAAVSVSSSDGEHTVAIEDGYGQGKLIVYIENQPASPEKYESGETPGVPMAHYGEDCWDKCGGKGGPCPSFCGHRGACCRDGHQEEDCPVQDWQAPAGAAFTAGSCGSSRHCCVFRDSIEQAISEGRVAWESSASAPSGSISEVPQPTRTGGSHAVAGGGDLMAGGAEGRRASYGGDGDGGAFTYSFDEALIDHSRYVVHRRDVAFAPSPPSSSWFSSWFGLEADTAALERTATRSGARPLAAAAALCATAFAALVLALRRRRVAAAASAPPLPLV